MEEKQCKHCAMMIPIEAKICPHCRKRQGETFVVGCLAVVIGIFIIGMVINLIPKNSPSGGKAVSSVAVGEEGRIDSGGKLTPVAITEKALDEWISAGVAKDDDGLLLLIKHGKIFTVEQGARVLVIDQSMFKRKIRIKEGKAKGMSGWVPMEYVK